MSNQIESFYITSLTQGSHYQFHADIYGYIRTATPEALHIETQAAAYLQKITLQSEIINQNHSIAFTDELKELDTVRDRWLGQFNNTIDIAAMNPNATTAAAGNRLKKLAAPYRGISGNEYTKQTSQMDGLLRDLGTDAAADDVDLLLLGPIVQGMRQSNNAFKAKYDERVDMEATRTRSTTDSRENRKAMDADYAAIVKLINAYALTASTDVIVAFVNRVNARINLARGIITRQQAGGTGNEKITQKLNKAIDKTNKAKAKMEKSKAVYDKDRVAYEKALEEQQALEG